ncbi:hypothetical protein ACFFGT_04870 [Mucilaginibacter angelicae]|uniref:Uncharacterized protein n=1 Tax=Mucilaginibacter angelicae TaxID=869718 RepID=A0ABV6L1D7_9SPHI
MKTRNEIIEQIRIELAAIKDRKYTSNGAPLFTIDPTVISLDYAVSSGNIMVDVNVYGSFDIFLKLKSQIDMHSKLNDYPNLQQEISADLTLIEAKINNEP